MERDVTRVSMLALTLLAFCNAAKANDAETLDRLGHAMSVRYHAAYLGTRMFYCNVRPADWSGAVTRWVEASIRDDVSRAVRNAGNGVTMERSAFLMWMEYRRTFAAFAIRPSTESICVQVRANSRDIAFLDRIVSGQH